MAKNGIRLWIDAHRPAPEGWTTATTIDAARSLIESGVEEVSISADVQSLKDNGLALVLWMARTGSWPHARPTVHGAKIPAKIVDAAVALAWPVRTRVAGLGTRIGTRLARAKSTVLARRTAHA